jgi:hypothetical protein
MAKTMCKKSKEKRNIVLAKKPMFQCKKCRATAHKEKHLCKPIKFVEAS